MTESSLLISFGTLIKSPYTWFALAGILFVRTIYLTLRVSAYRVDRPGGGYFGLPYFWNWKYTRKNFTKEGQPVLRKLNLTAFLLWITITVALVLLNRDRLWPAP